MTTGKYCCNGATALKKSVRQSVVPFAKPIAKADAVIEFVASPKWPMVQGEKSDPPVGIGRGLKPRAEKAAERGRSEYRAAFFSFVVDIADDFLALIFGLAIFPAHPIFHNGGRKAPKTNMLAAAFVGLATNQIA